MTDHERIDWSSRFARLETFADLKPGWDSYSADPITPLAIANAREFLRALQAADYPPTRVAPSVVGGVGITRREGVRKAYIEFYNEGTAHALFADDSNETMHTAKVEPTPAGYAALIAKMRIYLATDLPEEVLVGLAKSHPPPQEWFDESGE